jgi:hypothetical protein
MRYILLLGGLFICKLMQAQQPVISFDKPFYHRGDTVSFYCHLKKKDTKKYPLATLYLLIENIASKEKWHFRYPLLEGISNGDLIISDKIPDGVYTFSFLVRNEFFSIRGHLQNTTKRKMSYLMRTRNNQSVYNEITTDRNGYFLIRDLLFQDSAYFVFSDTRKKNMENLDIKLSTRLDSLFIPDADEQWTKMIGIGEVADTNALKGNQVEQPFLKDFFITDTTLPGISVYGKVKKKVMAFDEEYSRGFFNNINARIFDGLEDTKIAASSDVFQFLASMIADFRITRERGEYNILWRAGESLGKKPTNNVDVFVDEELVPKRSPDIVNTADIAMIKIYPPPAYMSPLGGNGAVAIYTKKEQAGTLPLSRQLFKVFGYSPLVQVWK